MEIISDGRLVDFSLEVHCRECDSHLRLRAKDIEYDPGQDYPVAYRRGYYFTCAVCKQYQYMQDQGAKWPKGVHAAIKARYDV